MRSNLKKIKGYFYNKIKYIILYKIRSIAFGYVLVFNENASEKIIYLG